jgi:hypothetical protein
MVYEDHNTTVWMHMPIGNVKPGNNAMKTDRIVTLYRPSKTYSRDIYIYTLIIALLIFSVIIW